MRPSYTFYVLDKKKLNKPFENFTIISGNQSRYTRDCTNWNCTNGNPCTEFPTSGLLYKHNSWQHDQNWIVSVRIFFFRMVKSLQSMQAKTYTKGDLCRGLLSNLIFLGTPLTLRKSLLPSWLVSYHKKVYLFQAWSIEQNVKGV